MAVACVILTALTVWSFVAFYQGGRQRHPEMQAGGALLMSFVASMICPGIFALIPILVLWKSRLSQQSRSLKSVVRSQVYRGGGFSDLTISNNARLPQICLCCGTATSRVTPLRYENAQTEASVYDWRRAGPFVILGLFMPIVHGVMAMAFFWQPVEARMKRLKAAGGAVTFRIPHCRSCAKDKPIVQRHFDFHGRKMIVDAHPAFRAAMSA
ncbi:MAG: hypothetical protein QM755_11050 [Luteolibacter sp.]